MWNKYVQMQHACMHVPAFLHGISCGACADVHSCTNKHPLWNMYKCPVTVLIFRVWIKDDTSVFSYGVTAFASQWRTTQGPPFRNQGSIGQGQQEALPPTQRAASSVEWVFHVYAGMFDQLRHGEMKASRDHRWTSNCSALTSCRMNVHAQKRGISTSSFFNLHWQTWSSLLVPK